MTKSGKSRVLCPTSSVPSLHLHTPSIFFYILLLYHSNHHIHINTAVTLLILSHLFSITPSPLRFSHLLPRPVCRCTTATILSPPFPPSSFSYQFSSSHLLSPPPFCLSLYHSDHPIPAFSSLHLLLSIFFLTSPLSLPRPVCRCITATILSPPLPSSFHLLSPPYTSTQHPSSSLFC